MIWILACQECILIGSLHAIQHPAEGLENHAKPGRRFLQCRNSTMVCNDRDGRDQCNTYQVHRKFSKSVRGQIHPIYFRMQGPGFVCKVLIPLRCPSQSNIFHVHLVMHLFFTFNDVHSIHKREIIEVADKLATNAIVSPATVFSYQVHPVYNPDLIDYRERLDFT